jgi:glycosyltransferase involved in cell wall biosynthesis
MSQPLAGFRIGLVTASASRLGGGVFEAVAAQAALIRKLGGEAPVFALDDRHSGDDAHRFAGSELVHCPVVGPAQIGYAPQLLERLLAANLDCLHLHGIWMYPSRAAVQWAWTTKRRYVVSPHGMLDPWITARGKWKKSLARLGYERASWRAASVMHALTASEAEEIRVESGRSDASVIPNPAPEPGMELHAARAPIVAFIGRIHPKKNLLGLVAGWRCADLPQAAQLKIAGWGEPGDVAALEAAVAAAGPAVRFLGPVYAKDKQDLLDRARFTILPSFGEGLPMAVLEGWAAGTPAILSAKCNLPEGIAAGAAIACGHTPEAIAQALEIALTRDAAAWLAMAKAAQALAHGPFSAASVAARWAAVYRGEDCTNLLVQA